jgi:hypothetical protein
VQHVSRLVALKSWLPANGKPEESYLLSLLGFLPFVSSVLLVAEPGNGAHQGCNFGVHCHSSQGKRAVLFLFSSPLRQGTKLSILCRQLRTTSSQLDGFQWIDSKSKRAKPWTNFLQLKMNHMVKAHERSPSEKFRVELTSTSRAPSTASAAS